MYDVDYLNEKLDLLHEIASKLDGMDSDLANCNLYDEAVDLAPIQQAVQDEIERTEIAYEEARSAEIKAQMAEYWEAVGL